MIPIIIKIGSFIWQYKTYFAAAIIIFAIYSYGYLQGKDHERTKCQAAIQKIYDDIEKAKRAAQAEIDRKAQEYEQERAEKETRFKAINQRLQDEKRKNTSFASCHVGHDVLQSYNELAGDTAR